MFILSLAQFIHHKTNKYIMTKIIVILIYLCKYEESYLFGNYKSTNKYNKIKIIFPQFQEDKT
jgi:hypothetical protein